jgi:putative Mg2+ transporter-C (MgtC) family protein
METIEMDLMQQLMSIGEVGLALILGGIIGVEREIADKPAGFRTHMLVAGAAALLVNLAHVFVQRYDSMPHMQILRSDPLRIVEAIITGISFLGAGTIFRRTTESHHIEGLTTAATILFAAAVGISVGLEQFVLAAGVTGLALFVLRGLIFVQRWIDRMRSARKNPRD